MSAGRGSEAAVLARLDEVESLLFGVLDFYGGLLPMDWQVAIAKLRPVAADSPALEGGAMTDEQPLGFPIKSDPSAPPGHVELHDNHGIVARMEIPDPESLFSVERLGEIIRQWLLVTPGRPNPGHEALDWLLELARKGNMLAAVLRPPTPEGGAGE